MRTIKPLEERFWGKVQKTSDCWEWTGNKTRKGYGLFSTLPKPERGIRCAHVVSYELAGGLIPDGMLVCHHCDNPRCVRPEHLFLGTPADNSRDMVNKGRSAKGSRHSQAKLDESKVQEIRRLRGTGMHQKVIAEKFGVARTLVSRIVNRRIWTHI